MSSDLRRPGVFVIRTRSVRVSCHRRPRHEGHYGNRRLRGFGRGTCSGRCELRSPACARVSPLPRRAASEMDPQAASAIVLRASNGCRQTSSINTVLKASRRLANVHFADRRAPTGSIPVSRTTLTSSFRSETGWHAKYVPNVVGTSESRSRYERVSHDRHTNH
jgi:hypothetical protein